MSGEAKSARTQVKRKPSRGVYDQEQIHAILDEALTSTVGFVDDDQPFAVPTVHGRLGERLYFHGSPANRTLNTLASGSPCCITAALVDGIVLGRTAKKHSLNYRAVMVLGVAREVTDKDEKVAGLVAIIEHMIPGRIKDVGPPDENELASTLLISMNIAEASAKVRTGDPTDPPSSLELPVWAGQLPLRVAADAPIPDPGLDRETTTPDYLLDWSRPERR
ncbi:MAG TPA: pyridoxamine 5'-phosphate oxidase family protein [Solirubrobacterales bacterium]|nr:pyridoxamine 5'-phosphate oxidase family protein [Solirubrobacterales bacterium]